MPANPHIQGDERIRTAVSVKPYGSRHFVGPRGCPSFVQALVIAAVLLYLSSWLLAVAVSVSVWAYGKAQR